MSVVLLAGAVVLLISGLLLASAVLSSSDDSDEPATPSSPNGAYHSTGESHFVPDHRTVGHRHYHALELFYANVRENYYQWSASSEHAWIDVARQRK